MHALVKFIIISCTFSILTKAAAFDETTISADEDTLELNTYTDDILDDDEQVAVASDSNNVKRSLENSAEVHNDYSKQHHHSEFKRRAKPLKSIFMGIYKNYKSTYLGNKTLTDYKNKLRERTAAPDITTESVMKPNTSALSEGAEDSSLFETSTENNEGKQEFDSYAESKKNNGSYALKTKKAITGLTTRKMERKRKRKTRNKINKKQRKRLKRPQPLSNFDPLLYVYDSEYHYNVGSGVNMTLDMKNDLINVNLDTDNLKEIIDGRWLNDNSEEGRGKKYDMITKVLPLFILPFLIQSAIVPFLVTKLKLLVMKSILVGKLAIFLLILSAIKNNSKSPQAYEVAPSYWAGEPSRRSELAAIASSAAYNGYRVEGKPTAWIN
ncbi:uncharacterized protein LOC119676905 [Teleopsis dalmanni]|uniref:uncharacterized protein LOC119676905 n=1 Tax=Teleopsis dalmanni TaxID=139649 RepID=UPI0018CCD9E3|nr:uncharacterized protein LOC119676905 [Teleopsis dalmanni]